MYSEKQIKVLAALNKMKEAADKVWFSDGGVVEAVNELADAIEDKEEYYDASFPPEIDRAIDQAAFKTAWIYDRLTGNDKKGNAVRRALGYNV